MVLHDRVGCVWVGISLGMQENEMATYGTSLTPGSVPFTGYTNSLGNGPANAPATVGSVYYNGIQQGDDRLSKMLRNGGMTASSTTLLQALIGVTVGAAANKSKKQIKWEQGSPGGIVPIESVSLVNRNTTAADVTAFQALLARNVFPTTYPADLSGNGGGGKGGY